MSKQAEVQLTSQSKFDTPNFEVASELLGRSHVFTFEGHEVAIALPTSESLPGYDSPGGYVKGERLSLSTWQGTQIPYVIVHNVDVMVSIPGRTLVPEEARTIPITLEGFSEEQQKRLETLATDYGNLARRAFDLWIRTLRWKADDYWLGLPESGLEQRGWPAEIREKDTPNRLLSGGVHLTVHAAKPVTPKLWYEVYAALHSEQEPPIFRELLHDAMANRVRGDLRRSIVDAAVAAETYMRTIVREGLPTALDEQLKKYINTAQISRVREHFLPQRLGEQQREEYKNLLPDLRTLFEDRNTILHSGQLESLTATHCQQLIDSVRILLSLAPYR